MMNLRCPGCGGRFVVHDAKDQCRVLSWELTHQPLWYAQTAAWPEFNVEGLDQTVVC